MLIHDLVNRLQIVKSAAELEMPELALKACEESRAILAKRELEIACANPC